VFQRPFEQLRQLEQEMDELAMRAEQAMRTLVQQVRGRVEKAAKAIVLVSPATQVRRAHDLLQDAGTRLKTAWSHHVSVLEGALETVTGKLNSLSPLAVLARGYALAWKLPEHRLLRDASVLSQGDVVKLQLHKGRARLTVETVYPAGDETHG
jgi:exodeoxyribonuclease VII large subunit